MSALDILDDIPLISIVFGLSFFHIYYFRKMYTSINNNHTIITSINNNHTSITIILKVARSDKKRKNISEKAQICQKG